MLCTIWSWLSQTRICRPFGAWTLGNLSMLSPPTSSHLQQEMRVWTINWWTRCPVIWCYVSDVTIWSLFWTYILIHVAKLCSVAVSSKATKGKHERICRPVSAHKVVQECCNLRCPQFFPRAHPASSSKQHEVMVRVQVFVLHLMKVYMLSISDMYHWPKEHRCTAVITHQPPPWVEGQRFRIHERIIIDLSGVYIYPPSFWNYETWWRHRLFASGKCSNIMKLIGTGIISSK